MNLRNIILLSAFVLAPLPAMSMEFINPLHFDNSKEQEVKVLSYIQENAYNSACTDSNTACDIDMVKSIAQINLDSFKWLINNATNKAVLTKTVNEYCMYENNACSYEVIKIMYVKEIKAKSYKLKW